MRARRNANKFIPSLAFTSISPRSRRVHLQLELAQKLLVGGETNTSSLLACLKFMRRGQRTEWRSDGNNEIEHFSRLR